MPFTGKLLIFCAPSGAGKTTIVHHLLQKFSERLDFSISATTRPPRGEEQHGADYYFLSTADFDQKLMEGAFVEYAQVYDDVFYGTLYDELRRIWQQHKHVLFDIDIEGAANLKRQFGERALTVFVQPPSLQVLEERLRKRQTDDEATIRKRLRKAKTEMQAAPQFDQVLVNDELSRCLSEAESLTEDFLQTQLSN